MFRNATSCPCCWRRMLSARFLAVKRTLGELTIRDALAPVRAADLVIDHLHAVEPVLDVVPPGDDAHRVPLPRHHADLRRRRIEVVTRSRPPAPAGSSAPDTGRRRGSASPARCRAAA